MLLILGALFVIYFCSTMDLLSYRALHLFNCLTVLPQALSVIHGREYSQEPISRGVMITFLPCGSFNHS